MRILFVSHTAIVSGAEQVLLQTLELGRDRFDAHVVCPAGPLRDAVERLGIPVTTISGTDLSGRLHPLHTPRELARVARTAIAVRSVAGLTAPNLIHAQTHRAALVSLLASGRAGVPPVVQVHDSLPPGRLPRVMFRLISARASGFLTTTEFLARQFPPRHPPTVVPNAVDPRRFDPAAHDRAAARAALGLDPAAPVVAVVGQLSPHKAQDDAIEALVRTRLRHPTAELLVVGSAKFSSEATRFDNRAYERELHELARRRGVAHATRFLGERGDVAAVLAAIDLLIVPSWYEPFGLVAAEAMAMGLPVVATAVGGISEVVVEGTTGRLLPPRDPVAWGDAISDLLDDPLRCRRLGAAGRERALRELSPERMIDRVCAFYSRTLAGRRPATTLLPT